jgi:hypothetical protein
MALETVAGMIDFSLAVADRPGMALPALSTGPPSRDGARAASPYIDMMQGQASFRRRGKSTALTGPGARGDRDAV